jgi:hypothetical protein
MRFYEFAPAPNRPVLKISQQAQQTAVSNAAAQPANTPTPFPRNTAPTPTAPVPIKVYPRAWQHDWVQKHLAAQIAKSAQTVKPTEDDLAIASMRYAEAQRAADEEYERTHNVPHVNRRWVRRT